MKSVNLQIQSVAISPFPDCVIGIDIVRRTLTLGPLTYEVSSVIEEEGEKKRKRVLKTFVF